MSSERSFKPMVATDPVLARATVRAADNIRRDGLTGAFEQHRKAVARDAAKVAPSVEITIEAVLPSDT